MLLGQSLTTKEHHMSAITIIENIEQEISKLWSNPDGLTIEVLRPELITLCKALQTVKDLYEAPATPVVDTPQARAANLLGDVYMDPPLNAGFGFDKPKGCDQCATIPDSLFGSCDYCLR